MASAKADPGLEARRGMHLARRVVIKAGTPVVTHCDGKVALGRIGSLVEQVAILRQQGREVVIVSSGAIATGIERMRKTMALNQTVHETMLGARDVARPGPSAAVGQALLMNLYETMFSKYNLSCAQVLLTEDELSDGDTLSQARDTTMELLGLGTIPIINDNDAITSRSVPVVDEDTGEIRWDNDSLAAVLASALRADLLVMLTDMDSLYVPAPPGASVRSPQRLPIYHTDAEFVRDGFMHSDVMTMSDSARGKFAGRSRMSAEGLEALVDSAKSAVAGGVRTAVMCTGHHPLSLVKLMRGEDIGTLFLPPNPTPAARL
jgi:delta-1-pyrroline-5-carboxylate synthetase